MEVKEQLAEDDFLIDCANFRSHTCWSTHWPALRLLHVDFMLETVNLEKSSPTFKLL